MTEVSKQEVASFYDKVGWQSEGDGLFQNAEYEDLRKVSQSYIARAHARVGKHLPKRGKYLLDAGSGPVQYEAYLKYSEGFEKRVCLDLSFVAMQEARKKLGEKGFYVVSDVANLPFAPESFDGIVSLHTIHHLPIEEKADAYLYMYKGLKPGGSMVTVDGWGEHKLAKFWEKVIALARRLRRAPKNLKPVTQAQNQAEEIQKVNGPAGTHVVKTSAAWFKSVIGDKIPYQIRSWRSVSVRFLREVVPDNAFGRLLLLKLSWLEDLFPRYFGENGQYPLIVFSKPKRDGAKE
jgi:SAM-dependent methyltransferase